LEHRARFQETASYLCFQVFQLVIAKGAASFAGVAVGVFPKFWIGSFRHKLAILLVNLRGLWRASGQEDWEEGSELMDRAEVAGGA